MSHTDPIIRHGIEITEEVDSTTEVVYLLEEIAKQVGEGYTSGFHPTWKLTERQV